MSSRVPSDKPQYRTIHSRLVTRGCSSGITAWLMSIIDLVASMLSDSHGKNAAEVVWLYWPSPRCSKPKMLALVAHWFNSSSAVWACKCKISRNRTANISSKSNQLDFGRIILFSMRGKFTEPFRYDSSWRNASTLAEKDWFKDMCLCLAAKLSTFSIKCCRVIMTGMNLSCGVRRCRARA